jgi:hypothetical protein
MPDPGSHDRPETILEMARRHVREGEERLTRQATLVIAMEGGGNHWQAALARRVLQTMRTALELQKCHLRDIEARSKR